MIKKITIDNISSISHLELDFEKGNYKFLEHNVENDVLKTIGIYGHNGSGKTSFFIAIAQFINFMSLPVDNLNPFVVNQLKYDEFMKIQNSGKQPKIADFDKIIGTISFDFEIDGDTYFYQLSVAAFNQILKERLIKNSVTIFDRDEHLKVYYKGKTIENNVGLVPFLRSAASNYLDDADIQKVYSYLSSFVFVDLTNINSKEGFVTSKLFQTTKTLDLVCQKSEDVKSLLVEYKDFPVFTVEKEEAITNNGQSEQYYVSIEDNGERIRLPFAFISTGMKNQTVLLSLILSMNKGSVLFIDELEMGMHPSTIKNFIEVAQNKGIQLVFSSHNTNTLQDMRPDQIYFASWKKGYSTFKRLSKIYPNIREVNNIEKMYMSSVFDEVIDGENN